MKFTSLEPSVETGANDEDLLGGKLGGTYIGFKKKEERKLKEGTRANFRMEPS